MIHCGLARADAGHHASALASRQGTSRHSGRPVRTRTTARGKTRPAPGTIISRRLPKRLCKPPNAVRNFAVRKPKGPAISQALERTRTPIANYRPTDATTFIISERDRVLAARVAHTPCPCVRVLVSEHQAVIEPLIEKEHELLRRIDRSESVHPVSVGNAAVRAHDANEWMSCGKSGCWGRQCRKQRWIDQASQLMPKWQPPSDPRCGPK